MRRHQRTADPFAPLQKDALSRLDVDNQRDYRERDREALSRANEQQRIVVCTTVQWFREDVPANAVTQMRVVIPTGSGTFGSDTNDPRTARQGRIVRATLRSNAARVAGTCFLRLRVTDGSGVATDYDFTDCILDGLTHPEFGYTRSVRASQALNYADGYPYAGGDIVGARLVTDAAWSPTTADMVAEFVLAEEEFVDA